LGLALPRRVEVLGIPCRRRECLPGFRPRCLAADPLASSLNRGARPLSDDPYEQGNVLRRRDPCHPGSVIVDPDLLLCLEGGLVKKDLMPSRSGRRYTGARRGQLSGGAVGSHVPNRFAKPGSRPGPHSAAQPIQRSPEDSCHLRKAAVLKQKHSHKPPNSQQQVV